MLKKLHIFGVLILMLTVSLTIGAVLTACDLQGENGELHNYETVVEGLLYEVTVNGETLFTTQSLEGYFAAVSGVESTMSERLGYPHRLADDFSIKLVSIETKAKVASSQEMYDLLLGKTESLYSDCYAIYLDASVVGYCPLSEKDNLQGVVAGVAQYVSGKDGNHNESSAVYAIEGYAKKDSIAACADDIKNALLSASNSDTLLNDKFESNVVDIIESIDSALLFGSGEIPENITPAVTVTTERKRRTETEAVPFEKLRAPDTDFGLMYGDDDPEFVHIKGKDGQCTVEYEDVYINGEYSHTVRIDESVIITVEPIDEVTVYGTQSTTWDGGKFIWPTVGWVTSEYGYRVLSGKKQFHDGIDIARNGNPKIVAAAAGTVVYVSSNGSGSYGWNLIIDHGNGIATRYAHMCRRPEVKVGDKVYQGEHIGNMGSTGWVTGAHLHFEVLVGFVDINHRGDFVNPRKYLATGKPAVQW